MEKPDSERIIIDAALKVFSSKGRDKFNGLFRPLPGDHSGGADERLSPQRHQARYLTYVFLARSTPFSPVMILGEETLTPGREKRIIDGIIQVLLHGAATG